MPIITRRGFLRGAGTLAGAYAGARMAGPLVREAHAAGETSHLVFVYFPGGYNAIFGGCANVFAATGAFETSSQNIKNVGNGVFTDLGTLGNLPQFGLDHWSAIGVIHGQALHTTTGNPRSGGEYAFCRRGSASYLTTLAAAMGGDSTLKAAVMGGYPAFRVQPASGAVSMQQVLDLSEALKAVGAQAPDPNLPSRDLAGASLAAAESYSKGSIAKNPDSLRSLGDAYKSSAATLTKAPPKPVSLDEIKVAYGLASNAVGSFASQMAGAEAMIRGAGSNVVSVFDGDDVIWDYHQLSGGQSLNGRYSRGRFAGTSGVGRKENRVASLQTFINRMLNLPDRNVVLVLTGDFVRIPNGDHGAGTVATVMSKYTKQGLQFPCASNGRFAVGTPTMDAFWAGIAAALKCPGQPFGADPYKIT